MSFRILASVSVAAFLCLPVANALTLKEKKKAEEWKAYLEDASQSYTKSFEDKCGYKLPVTFDEKMVTPFMEANSHLGSYCDSARSAMSGMCDEKLSKEAISKKIKKVSCKLAAGKDELKFDLKGTELVVTFNTGSSNMESKAKEFLENKL